MPNWDLIDKTFVEMRQHPESFEMSEWGFRKTFQEEPNICNTTMCFAGWVVQTAGSGIRWDEGNMHGDWANSGKSISDEARELLEIDQDQAARIFSGTHPSDIDEYEEFLRDFFGREV